MEGESCEFSGRRGRRESRSEVGRSKMPGRIGDEVGSPDRTVETKAREDRRVVSLNFVHRRETRNWRKRKRGTNLS